MKIGVSPITNTIFAGNAKNKGNGLMEWTKKEDVTDDAIRAVFEWFMNNSKDEGGSIYQISFKGFGTLTYDPNGVIEKESDGE
jgi:hypothetical protein